MINTYQPAANTVADARVTHAGTRVCYPTKRESSPTGGQRERYFIPAVSPFRLPFADPLIGSSSPKGCRASGQKERRGKGRVSRQSREQLSHRLYTSRPVAICNSMIRIYGLKIRRESESVGHLCRQRNCQLG